MYFLKRLSPYSFVITILWFGFVLALAFIETPLRFRPERISIDGALSIGRLVFHALNTAEILFALLIVFAAWLNRPRPKLEFRMQCLLAGLLVIQTMMLYWLLDPRVDKILAGEDVPKAIYHLLYISFDVIKLGLLSWLATYQIRDFEKSAGKR